MRREEKLNMHAKGMWFQLLCLCVCVCFIGEPYQIILGFTSEFRISPSMTVGSSWCQGLNPLLCAARQVPYLLYSHTPLLLVLKMLEEVYGQRLRPSLKFKTGSMISSTVSNKRGSYGIDSNLNSSAICDNYNLQNCLLINI